MKTLRRIWLVLGLAVMLAACGEAGGLITGTIIGCEVTDCLDQDNPPRR